LKIFSFLVICILLMHVSAAIAERVGGGGFHGGGGFGGFHGRGSFGGHESFEHRESFGDRDFRDEPRQVRWAPVHYVPLRPVRSEPPPEHFYPRPIVHPIFEHPYFFYTYPYYPFYSDVYFDSYFLYTDGYEVDKSLLDSSDYKELMRLEEKRFHYYADAEALSVITVTNISFSNQKDIGPVISLTVKNGSEFDISNITFNAVIKDQNNTFNSTFYFSLPQTLSHGEQKDYVINLKKYSEWKKFNPSNSARIAVSVNSITDELGKVFPEEKFTQKDQDRTDSLKNRLGITTD